jgi:hypothetical protein
MWSKLLLLAVAIAAVWYAFKIFARRSQSKPDRSAPLAIERTIKCARCGVYVPMIDAEPCARDGCPYLPSTGSGAP